MTLNDSRFMKACHRQPTDVPPVWFMRQAGRSLPEYRAIREQHTFMEVCRQPDLCAEVTLQPVRRLGVDAAILFADIMTPLIGIGVDLDLVENVGPVIAHPVRTEADLAQLRPLEPEQDIAFVTDTITVIRRELGDKTPLIGFAGAPFTLASYLIEGKGSRNFTKAKRMMFGAPDLWHALMDRLTTITITYLTAQVNAGVQAVQLFDSWVGALGPSDYATFVQPYSRRIIAAIRPTGIPFIHFGTGTGTLLPQMAQDGAAIIGVDWRLDLATAWEIIGHETAIQGNLDPAVLLAPWEYLRARTDAVLQAAAGRPGHIFNLGHGIYPETPVDNLVRLVDYIHILPGGAA